jgi:DNA-directed RNA polymerase specialized sigma24 family protein
MPASALSPAALSPAALPPVVLPPAAMPPVSAPPAGLPPAGRPAGPVSVLGRSAAAGESDADRAVTAMYGSHYRTLVRLAVLLVGDLRTAEAVVQDSFAAMHRTWRRLRSQDAALSFLHRSVVARSRLAGPGLAVAPRYEAPGEGAQWRPPRAVALREAEPEGAAGVVAALQRLPVMQREALALRLYLDLPDDQIAAAMRVTGARARDHVAGGLAALRGMA